MDKLVLNVQSSRNAGFNDVQAKSSRPELQSSLNNLRIKLAIHKYDTNFKI